MKNNKWKGKEKWTCCPPLFAQVFRAGNILKELPGLWSSSIKDLTFSLPTLPRFTIENQLSLWRACVLGRDLWRERKRSPVFQSIVRWKCSLNSTQHTKVTTQKDPCVVPPPISPMWLIAFGNQLRDRGSSQPIPQNLCSLIHPTLHSVFTTYLMSDSSAMRNSRYRSTQQKSRQISEESRETLL